MRIKIYFLLLGLFLLSPLATRAGIDGDPLYENTKNTNGASFFAIRPFFSYSKNPEAERWRKDFLWPIYVRKGFQDEFYARFLFFGYSQNFSEENNRYRNWIIPIYFQGKDEKGKGYFAIFPLGGTIREILGRDKVSFFLFPLYAQSQIKDIHSKVILWPIYARAKGGRVDRFRVWPFYGRSTLEDQFIKKFILWPFYSSVKYTNKDNPGSGFMLFPLYGKTKTKKAVNYWWIPPFFHYVKSDDQTLLHLPWPFIQIADGTLYKRIYWPIYGKRHIGDLTIQYMFWPIFWNNTTRYLYYEQHRRYILPIFEYCSKTATKRNHKHEEGEVFSRYWKLWPLMSWERNDQGSRFRMLEFWPLHNTPGIERNWAPWWTLYRREAHNGVIEHHVIWGLYRQTRSEDSFEWSLLKGLIGYKRTPNSHQVRFLFIPFGGKEK